MKRIFSMLLCLCLCAVLLPAAFAAEADVSLNSTNFPDAAFRSYIASEFDKNSDGKLSQTELAAVTSIQASALGIRSLKGVEHFTKLEDLNCGYNKLTALDVSNNRNLITLYCCYNQLTALDVSKQPSLWILDCTANQIRTLDISNNPSLATLSCGGNALTALDVSKNPELDSLDCSDNRLRALNVTKNRDLYYLSCQGNALDTLDISMCPDLVTAVRHGQKQTTDYVKYTWRMGGNSASLSLDASTRLISESNAVIFIDPASTTANQGQTAVFTVTADGKAPMRYQWYYRTRETGEWYPCTTPGCTTSSLQVEGKAYRNGYQYYCRVENDLGVCLSLPAKLTVIVKPVITDQPKSREIAVGHYVNFYVSASGENLSYQWYFRTSENGVWTKCTTTGYKTDIMTVQGKAYRDGYQYRCKVSNSAGAVYSRPATLTIGTPPVITKQPASQTAAVGEYVQFSVAASGEGLHYQWFYSASSGRYWNECTVEGCNTPTMRLQAKAYRNGYQYVCVVSNAVGYVDSDVVSLTVH